MGRSFARLKRRVHEVSMVGDDPCRLIYRIEIWVALHRLRCRKARCRHSAIAQSVPSISVLEPSNHAVGRVLVPLDAVGLAPAGHSLVAFPRPHQSGFLVAVQMGQRVECVKFAQNFRWFANAKLNRSTSSLQRSSKRSSVGHFPGRVQRRNVGLAAAFGFMNVEEQDVLAAFNGLNEGSVVGGA